MEEKDRRRHERTLRDANKHIRRNTWAPNLSNPYDVRPCWPWGFLFDTTGPSIGLKRMSIAWGRALQDGKRWDYYGCVDLNCSMMLSLAKTGWPRCEEAFRSTTREVPSTTISNLKQAIIDCYKARLASVRIELAAFPQVIAACEAQVRNLPQFFERVVGLISAGPGGDTAHYLTDLVVGGSGGQPNSAALFNECIGNLFRPCFAPDGGQSGAPVSNLGTEAQILWGFGGIPPTMNSSRQQPDQRSLPSATPPSAPWVQPPPYTAQRWTDPPRGASAPPTMRAGRGVFRSAANPDNQRPQLLLSEAAPRRPSSATIIRQNLASTPGLNGPPTTCPESHLPGASTARALPSASSLRMPS